MKMTFILGITILAVLEGSFVSSNQDGEFLDLFTHVNTQARIVGGSPAEEGSVPNMVAISVGAAVNNFVCGGSLITEQHILTAGHCAEAVYSDGALQDSLRVRLGSNQWNDGGQVYTIASNVTHQDYDPSIIKNDIAILITSTKVVLSDAVKPITVSYEFIDGGVLARAAGWGYIQSGGPISNVLLELLVLTISGQQCKDDLASISSRLPPSYPEVELCTYHSVGHGMCNGDSGSALVKVDNGEQIGIVSWGLPCALGAPDTFVRVSAFEDWIKDAIA